ncbi:alpha-tocopherol transfer protein [Leptinotarsa decemlineata]|uniref:alpha-tocopherol transfer protein n=1 Tax=Leptinotarsa decemlineata TaxID=7539 RepID=UPI003D3085EE
MVFQYFEPITNEMECKIWKTIGRTKTTAQKDIDLIKTWLNSQLHLPHTLSDQQIASFLIVGKGNIEKIKSKIDMYYTMRFLYPEIFSDSHPFSKKCLNVYKFLYTLPLPKTNKDLNRILVLKLKDADPSELDAYACCASLMNMADMRMLEDFCDGHLIIVDMEFCRMGHLAKLTPKLIRDIYNILGKAFTTRVVAIHLINAPLFLDQAIFLIKSLIKPKVANRIFVHKDMKSVVESIDKNILPKDYGGYEDSLEELEAKYLKKMEDRKDFFDQRENWVVMEDLRPSKVSNDEFLGYYGNFKKLDVD